MAKKMNSKPCQTSEVEIFPKVVTGCKAEFKTLQIPKMKPQKYLKTKKR